MKTLFQASWRCAAVLLAAIICAPSARAIDPPHQTPSMCGACHFPHAAPGADLTTVAGDANLCMSCHTAGGSASAHIFASADQALPWPGLGAGISPGGNSHRWDSGAAGHLQFLGGAATPSTGAIIPLGAYTNVYPKTYAIQIAASGVVGAATFNWSATSPGGGSGAGQVTSTNAPLDGGVSLAFVNGTNISFQAGDRWYVFVRNDLSNPTNTDVRLQLANGALTCSACHNQHSELLQPFDAAAQPYATNLAGTFIGTNRHFMRIANDLHQLCNDCHARRNVTNAAAGSHPVELTFIADANHRLPTLLPLEAATTNLGCLTCHVVHHGVDADGKTLRLASSLVLCDDCHTL
ncbi:MAG TPA: cytochrome c3 family protein, partial [Verrucomicrobiae bacterium]